MYDWQVCACQFLPGQTLQFEKLIRNHVLSVLKIVSLSLLRIVCKKCSSFQGWLDQHGFSSTGWETISSLGDVQEEARLRVGMVRRYGMVMKPFLW